MKYFIHETWILRIPPEVVQKMSHHLTTVIFMQRQGKIKRCKKIWKQKDQPM